MSGTNRAPDRYGSIVLALDLARRLRTPQTLYDLMDGTGLSLRTVHRLIAALRAAGCVIETAEAEGSLRLTYRLVSSPLDPTDPQTRAPRRVSRTTRPDLVSA